MKVMLESVGGKRYPAEVGDSCTLQELKEKVEKALEIPIARQILSFNGNTLRQDTDLLHVKNGSVIKFLVADGPSSSPLPFPTPTPKPEADILHLLLEIMNSEETLTVKACGGDTVGELKGKIQGKEGTPAGQILITTEEGIEIPDFRRLRDYSISFTSGVTVEFRSETQQPRKGRLSVVPSPPPPPPRSPPRTRSPSPSSSPSPSPRKKSRLSVMSSASPTTTTPAVDADKMSLVLFFRGIKMPEPVVVGRESMVREMRAQLEAMKFKAPGNRDYCFYHKQALLDEDRSFASQNVANGDIIHITPGSIKRNVS